MFYTYIILNYPSKLILQDFTSRFDHHFIDWKVCPILKPAVKIHNIGNNIETLKETVKAIDEQNKSSLSRCWMESFWTLWRTWSRICRFQQRVTKAWWNGPLNMRMQIRSCQLATSTFCLVGPRPLKHIFSTQDRR